MCGFFQMASLGTNIGRWIVSVLWCSCPSDKLFGWQRNIAADKQILIFDSVSAFFVFVKKHVTNGNQRLDYGGCLDGYVLV